MFQVILVLVALNVISDTMDMANMNTTGTLQNTSTSGIWETMKMFNILNNIQTTCIKLKKEGIGMSQHCHELIQGNYNYISLNKVIQIEMNKIRSILVNFSYLEKQAVVCRSTRLLLHIIMYGIFINNILHESIEDYSSGIEILDELFKVHSSKDQNLSYEDTIQEIEEFINNEKSKNKIYRSRNCKINQGKEKLIETYNIFLEYIKIIIQYSRRFIIKELKMFSDMYDKIHKVMTSLTIDIKNYRVFLLFIFKELYIMYKTECSPDADIILLFKSDHIDKIKQALCPIPRLTVEVDRLFINVRNDLKLLFVKFFPNIRNAIAPDISMAFYHSFGMYHYPDIWRLIGNEIIVDKMNSSEVTVLNNIIQKKENQINSITNKLNVSIENSVKCRCLRSINQTMKLYYYTIQVLIGNLHKVQIMSETMAEEQFEIKKYIKRVSDDISYAMNMSRQELSDVFDSFNNRMKELAIDRYYSINESNAISSTIDGLNLDRSIKNEFKSVFIIYSKYSFYRIDEIIQTISYYLSSLNFEINQIESMLKYMENTMYKVERETVEQFMKLFKCSIQMYKDNNCLSNDDNNLFDGSNENYNTNLTLGLIVENNDELDKHLEYDLKHSSCFTT